MPKTINKHCTAMIRLFLNVCKCFHKIKHLDDYLIYSHMEKLCFDEASGCPSCNAPLSKCSQNGTYPRHFVCYGTHSVCSHSITVHSLICSSCRKSHALLPSIIIPWSSYSLGFIISLLYARITRKFSSVLSLCEHFDISECTYYRLRKRFTLDSRLLLSSIQAFMGSLNLIQVLLSADSIILHSALCIFYMAAGYSFLQPCIKIRQRISSHKIPP